MKFIDSAIDENQPEYAVTGVSAVERISRNQVRVTYFRRREGESIEALHTVWDLAEWRRTCEMIRRACDAILAEPAPGQDDRLRLAPLKTGSVSEPV